MDKPLENIRHEKFCQLYAGKCFGYANKAYKRAGFKPKTDASARSEGSKLLTNLNIWGRIQFLREEGIRLLGIDRRKILETRMEIMRSHNTKQGDRLTALKDLERSLGLEPPTKIEHSGGAVLIIE